MKNTLFILLFSYCFSLIGQESVPGSDSQKINVAGTETIEVHLNTQTILPGEYLYFSVSVTSREGLENQKISKVAYIALINPLGEKVLQAQMLLNQTASNGSDQPSFLKPSLKNQSNFKNAKGQGDLFIPVSLPTGAYTLVGYTQQMLRQDQEDLFIVPLAVLNPYTSERIGAVNEMSHRKEVETSDNSLIPVFRPLEKISLQDLGLKNDENSGSIGTLSIRKKESLQSYAYFEKKPLEKIAQQTNTSGIKDFSLAATKEKNTQTAIQGEFHGATIRGRIVPKNNVIEGMKMNEVSIALSFLGLNMPFKLTHPGADGTFSFPINTPVNNSNVVLEIMGAAKEIYRLVLHPMPLPKLETLPKGTLQLYSKDLESITQRSVYNQIENAFNRFKPDSIALENSPISDFSHLKSQDYLLEEYTLFPTFEETVFEIISELSYQKTNDGGVVLYCKGVKRNVPIAAPPLLFIDGIPIENQEDFRNYTTQNMARIRVVQKQLVAGNKIWNGMVEISTKNGIPLEYINGNGLSIKDIALPELHKKYYQIQKNTQITGNNNNGPTSQLPHFNTQLVWWPHTTFSSNTASHYFYTSSVKGAYALKGWFRDQNGKQNTLTKTFRVE
jgi:signal recognition particle subunit SEC65